MGKAHYLIEYRFQGNAKSYIKEIIYEVAEKFGVAGVTRKGAVPHITLFGPLNTKNEKRIVSEVVSVSKNYDLVSFRLRGFIGIEKNNVIAIGIEPSEELKRLRKDIAQKLIPITWGYPPYEEFDDRIFHATIAFKDVSDEKFPAIWNYLKKKEEPEFKHHLLRVTVIKGSKILCEYDLMQKRILSRREALDHKLWERTMDIFFRKVGVYAPATSAFDKFRCFLIRALNKKRIFLISDLHLDHDNIIRYCNRPFKSRWDMNIRILRNWNNILKNCDLVYYLGDLAFGRESHPAKYWLNKLKGKIIFIKGSHDRPNGIKMHKSRTLNYKGYKFFLVHDPKDAPKNWDGWIIHGHHHNNHLDNFPFINGERRTINISAELLNYKPISIDELFALGLEKIRRMETIDSAPIPWN